MKRADEALADTWDIGPRAKPAYIAPPITWKEDPYSDKYWRFIFYSLRPTTNLLYAYYVSGDTRYRDKLLEVLRSYVAADMSRPDDWQNVPGKSRQPFDDRHTSGFRALVLVNTIGKLKRSGDLPADLDAALSQDLEKLGTFLAADDNFERFQNHGFNEAAGLLAIGANHPELSEAAQWEALAITRLNGLMHDTVDSDGVEIENSPFYHFYVLSAVIADNQWARKYGVTFSDEFAQKAAAMLSYATYIPQPDGFVPLQGASVTLDVTSLAPDLYADDEIPPIPDTDEPHFQYVRTKGKEGEEPPDSSRGLLFEESGQAVLRSGFGPTATMDLETHVAMNTGPWRGNHSHLDTLAFSYFGGGTPLLVDSGLYTYDFHNDTGNYDYFNGTRAHNTVVVDGADQYPGLLENRAPGVDYRTNSRARVTEGLQKTGETWTYQSGAHTLYDGVTHARSVLLLERDVALVLDTLTSEDVHDYAQTWHVFAGANVDASGLDVVASDPSSGVPALAVVQAATDTTITLDTVSGATAPMQGWFSARYGKMEPNAALEYHAQATAAHYATLLLSGNHAQTPGTVSATWSDDGTIHATVCVASGLGYEVGISQQGAGDDGDEDVSVQAASADDCP